MSESVIKVGNWRIAVSDDESTATFQIAEWLNWNSPSSSTSPMPSVRFVVEIHRPLGGRNSRALLGGELKEAEDRSFRVAQSSPIGAGGEASCRSLLGRDLVPGLPPEFAEATLKSLVRCSPLLGSGAVVIDRAGYDDVDSSPSAFDHAAMLLIRLLCGRAVVANTETLVNEVVSSW
jgi:hypothetical protein